MTFVLGARSLSRLEGVHPDLVKVVKRAIQLSTVDFTVGEGVRTAVRQAQLYAQGRSTAGPMVTWVRVSNHQAKSDGFGHAVDLWALKPDGGIDWDNHPAYTAIYTAMFAAAKELGVTLRAGSDWDMDGRRSEHGETDEPHFELHQT